MPPQCAQVSFCVFTVAACQRFSSIVLPVSVSFDVDGQRTSKLLMLRRVFAFAGRGGPKKNLVAISESINEQSLAYRPPVIRFATFAIPLDESFLTCARSSVSEI